MGLISRLACVVLDTPALAASVEFYTRGFGLDITDRSDEAVGLSGRRDELPSLVLRQADHAGLGGLEFEPSPSFNRADPDQALSDIEIVDCLPFSDGTDFCLQDPDGTPVRIRRSGNIAAVSSAEPSDRPDHLSHLVINSPDAARLVAFYVDRLGFRISDAYERELLTFLRCDQPQHHCLGIAPGDRAGLNHFAADCGSIDGLMKSVGRMKQAGHEPVWGPGRHGPGGNVFCYYADPFGLVAEFTCDVLQIEDDAAWVPRVWERTPLNGNVWGTGGPSPEAIRRMAGQAPPLNSTHT